MQTHFVLSSLVFCLFVFVDGGQAASRNTLITQVAKQMNLSPDTTQVIFTSAVQVTLDALSQGRDFSMTELTRRVAKKTGLPDSTTRRVLLGFLEAIRVDSVGLFTAGETAAQKIGVSEKKGVLIVGKAVDGAMEALKEVDRDVVSREILFRVAKGANVKEPTVREVLLALLEMASLSQEQRSTSRVPPPPQGLKRLQYTLKHPSEVFPNLRPESISSPEDVFTIQEIRGTSSKLRVGGRYLVRGTYTLNSLETAYLTLTCEGAGAGRSVVKLSKGSGTFEVKLQIGNWLQKEILSLCLLKKPTDERYIMITSIVPVGNSE